MGLPLLPGGGAVAVDPLCHTLVGAALAETGLKERTALGTATLLIGANLPDVDVVASLWDPATALWFRRGVTHGVLALLVLPPFLTGMMIVWDRAVRRRRTGNPVAIPRDLLLLSFLAVLTHPTLDFLNTYGVRWLMPFSDRWYYGDTLYIVDPWIWGALAVGIYLAWRKRRSVRRAVAPSAGGRRARPAVGWQLRSPATVALGCVAAYIALMAASNVLARRLVVRALAAQGLGRPERLMVAPRPITPFSRWVVIQDGDVYRFGRLDFLPQPVFGLEGYTVDAEPTDVLAAAATRGPRARKFQSWARFPYYVVVRRSDGARVLIGDARYTLDPEGSWAAVEIRIGSR